MSEHSLAAISLSVSLSEGREEYFSSKQTNEDRHHIFPVWKENFLAYEPSDSEHFESNEDDDGNEDDLNNNDDHGDKSDDAK